MDYIVFLFLLLQSLIQYPQPVGDGLDEHTHLRMWFRHRRLERKRIRLLQEVERAPLEQSVGAWGALLWSALQHWQVWAIAGLLLLLLGLWFVWRKRSPRREQHEEENDGGNEEEAGNGHENEEDNGVGNGVVNAAANAANNNDDANQVAVHRDVDDNIGRILEQRIRWPVQDLQTGCEWVTGLVDSFTIYFGHVVSDSFYPMPTRAIGVGSAFEGWSPREEDVVYSVLVPLNPPRGHTFRLEPELDAAGQRPGRNFRVRVELECTCTREQQGENVLCFLHHPEEQLRRNQHPSLLHTLCTDSYLDVHRTTRWFYQLVRATWPALPQSRHWHLVLLPSTRSCQFRVTNGKESFWIEMLFGVREGDTDIFVSSQPREVYTPRTMWPETYAVAEMKFFRHIASQAPPDSMHLKCLQFFTHVLLGTGFSAYTMKTIVMHLLNVTPVSRWRRRDFLQRLLYISENLRSCVEERRLNHFIVGNRRLPEVISLPPEVQMAETRNLFYRLEQDPAAHSQAMSEYQDLQHRLRGILLDDH